MQGEDHANSQVKYSFADFLIAGGFIVILCLQFVSFARCTHLSSAIKERDSQLSAKYGLVSLGEFNSARLDAFSKQMDIVQNNFDPNTTDAGEHAVLIGDETHFTKLNELFRQGQAVMLTKHYDTQRSDLLNRFEVINRELYSNEFNLSESSHSIDSATIQLHLLTEYAEGFQVYVDKSLELIRSVSLSIHEVDSIQKTLKSIKAEIEKHEANFLELIKSYENNDTVSQVYEKYIQLLRDYPRIVNSDFAAAFNNIKYTQFDSAALEYSRLYSETAVKPIKADSPQTESQHENHLYLSADNIVTSSRRQCQMEVSRLSNLRVVEDPEALISYVRMHASWGSSTSIRGVNAVMPIEHSNLWAVESSHNNHVFYVHPKQAEMFVVSILNLNITPALASSIVIQSTSPFTVQSMGDCMEVINGKENSTTCAPVLSTHVMDFEGFVSQNLGHVEAGAYLNDVNGNYTLEIVNLKETTELLLNSLEQLTKLERMGSKFKIFVQYTIQDTECAQYNQLVYN